MARSLTELERVQDDLEGQVADAHEFGDAERAEALIDEICALGDEWAEARESAEGEALDYADRKRKALAGY